MINRIKDIWDFFRENYKILLRELKENLNIEKDIYVEGLEDRFYKDSCMCRFSVFLIKFL